MELTQWFYLISIIFMSLAVIVLIVILGFAYWIISRVQQLKKNLDERTQLKSVANFVLSPRIGVLVLPLVAKLITDIFIGRRRR